MDKETRCVNCGSNIEKDYILFINGAEFVFDSFECAVKFVAPRCAHCNSIIMGKGFSKSDELFCSVSCSNETNFSPLIP